MRRQLGLGLAVAAFLSHGDVVRSRAQTAITVTADPPLNRPTKASSDQTIQTRSASLDAFIEELSTLSDKLDSRFAEDRDPSKGDLAKLRSSLPKEWSIQTSDGNFVISSAPLDKALETGKTDDAEAWVEHVLGEAQHYARPQGHQDAYARQQLDKILGATEFSAVHPPSALDMFRQRLAAWVTRMAGKFFGGIARHPMAGDILFWGILLLAVSLLARWLFQFLVNRDRREGIAEVQIVAANRTWQEWIRQAREAAARQDFREAVHSAYWAGIARLEDLRVLPKDRTKTPREYLRVISPAPQNELAVRPTNYAEPLKELTSRLEDVWYANRGAKADDFADTLEQLKALGCQLE